MKETADVIIVGAGIIGCSIAFNLARRGCRRVVVIEKDTIGSGSTGKCAGGIRQQFSSEINVRLSMESVKFYEAFEEHTGCPADFRQNGYLILALGAEEDEEFRRNVLLQNGLGLKVDYLQPDRIRGLVPGLNTADIVGGTLCPTDGFADPYSVVQGFASAARRLGARICEGVAVTGFMRRGDRICGVLTTEGEIEAPVTINAAGPHSSVVGRMAGLNIPVQPHRRQIFVTQRTEEIGSDWPLVVEFRSGFWFRREGPCAIFGMRDPDQKESFDTGVDWGLLPKIAGVALNRAPVFERLGVIRGQAGLHEDTPDANPVLGWAAQAEGLFLACGFSGHGFMQAPAVGRLVAQLVLGEEFGLPDLTCFGLERFGRETAYSESVFI